LNELLNGTFNRLVSAADQTRNRFGSIMPDEFRGHTLMASHYDVANDRMFLLGNPAAHPDACTPINGLYMGTYVVARYEAWSATTGPRTANRSVQLPVAIPDAQDDFVARVTDVLCGCIPDGDWAYNSFDVAGDMVFVAEHRGSIHALRAGDLSEATRL
jgi:hypothetical protein